MQVNNNTLPLNQYINAHLIYDHQILPGDSISRMFDTPLTDDDSEPTISRDEWIRTTSCGHKGEHCLQTYPGMQVTRSRCTEWLGLTQSNLNYPKEEFTYSDPSTGISIEGYIQYPKWEQMDGQVPDRCVLVHNPNGVIPAHYYDEDGNLAWTPKKLMALYGCPIVMYHYRGVLKEDSSSSSSSSSSTTPDYDTVVQDGEVALKYAFSQFSRVEICGIGLGGAVGIASTEKFLTSNPDKEKNLSIISLDSFSVSSRVVNPDHHILSYFWGSATASVFNIIEPLRSLTGRKINVLIFEYANDPIFPPIAKMSADSDVTCLLSNTNIQIMQTGGVEGHGNITPQREQVLASRIQGLNQAFKLSFLPDERAQKVADILTKNCDQILKKAEELGAYCDTSADLNYQSKTFQKSEPKSLWSSIFS